MKSRRSFLVVLAACLLTVSGCSSASSPDASEASAAPAANLAFGGPTLDGDTLDAATLAGTPVVLWFWAPWCTVCRVEAPDVAKVAAEYDGRVRFLGVPGRGEAEAMRQFVADTGTGDIAHVVDDDGSRWQRFGVVAQPAFAFIGADGSVETFGGGLGQDELRKAADRLLAQAQ